MRATGLWAAVVSVILASCASSHPKPDEASSQAAQGGVAQAPHAGSTRFVDPSLGFEISRPDDSWEFVHGAEAPEGLEMPVVVAHRASGAQVVVQVAPDVAPPQDFAARLAIGLQSRSGFSTTMPEVDGDGRASFLFKLGDEVFGKVNVLNATDRLFVLLATWPANAPAGVVQDIDGILQSLHTTEGAAAQVGCRPGACQRL